jgi:hypothetical protein
MMAVKFKVGFTMSAETLFGIIAKFLPIEDLQVEEIEPPRTPLRVEKIARLGGPENRPAPLKGRNRYSGPSLEGGVNAVILKALEDGKPRRYAELKKALAASGYAASGIGSRLARLKDLNAVHQPDLGLWQIGGEARKRA